MFLRIMDPRIGYFPDKITYKRDKSVYVKYNIEHEAWSAAPISRQIDMLAENLANGVQKIKETRLNAEDRVVLLAAIEKARATIAAKAGDLTDEALTIVPNRSK